MSAAIRRTDGAGWPFRAARSIACSTARWRGPIIEPAREVAESMVALVRQRPDLERFRHAGPSIERPPTEPGDIAEREGAGRRYVGAVRIGIERGRRRADVLQEL